MSFVNTSQMRRVVHHGHYCVSAFNVVDYLTLEAVVRVAEQQHSPVINQTSSGIVQRYAATLASDYHADHKTGARQVGHLGERGLTAAEFEATFSAVSAPPLVRD